MGGGGAIFSHGTSNSRGIAIFFSKKLKGRIQNTYKDTEGRVIMIDIENDGRFVTLVAIYAPNKDEPGFFQEISKQLKSRYEHKVVIGDFNLTLDVELDRLNTYNNNSKAKEEVENMMDQYSLRDVWRVQNGERREFSWRKVGSMNIASRIDLALVSAGIDQMVKAIQYIASVKTDHRAIYMCLDLDSFERGRGSWKLNTKFLSNQDYILKMNILIEEVVQSQGLSKLEKWEQLKAKAKKFTVKYARESSSEEKIIISQLSEKVNEYEANFPLEEHDFNLWMETKSELEEKLIERVRGIMFRSKVKWYEEGEKNTRYFFSLEKARYNSKTCFKVMKENGEEVSNPQEILEVQKDFYSELYSQEDDVEFTLENSTGIMISEEVRKQQEQQISIEELELAIRHMNNEKTPGPDGLPVEFYKVFWSRLKHMFYDMMLESYDSRKLHPSARKGILNLIPKTGKDSRYIKNLRPITLLNTDYKIIEKAIANKMLPALEEIINKDQRGFMKNRRISVNIRKMLDIMYYTKKEDLEAVILSLDFVKCFDKCSFSILHGSLNFFGFGEIIKVWTKVLYDDFTVKVQNNGYFSDPIEIKKGVHQGGCCSAVYFLVIAEILAIALRENEKIEGITIRSIKHLLNQFADDMDVGTIASEQSLKEILAQLEWFRYQSGFTVSYEKTTLYRIGSLRHSCARMYDINQVKWSNEDITVLGVTIAHSDLEMKNYDEMAGKVRKVLNAWYNRGLSLIGKVQVVNTLVASLFVYKMMVLPTIPKGIIKAIDSIIREFLWNGKKSKIAYWILQNPKKEGGLNLVDLDRKDKALKATWPQILVGEPEYADLVYANMRCTVLQHDVWRCSILPEHVETLKGITPFWKDVWKSWSSYNFPHNRRIENQIIWYNSCILIEGKVVMWKDVYARGLKYVYQLFEAGQFKSFEQVNSQYGLSILRYNGLKKSLPLEWKVFFCSTQKSEYMPLAPHNYDTCVNVEKRGFSRKVYSYIADDVSLIHYKYLKWQKELGTEFCGSIWEYGKLHMDIYVATNVTKYRSFQYRLLQRGLITNIQLSEWKIISSKMCTFCKMEEETILHLFFYCEDVQELWRSVIEYVIKSFGVNREEIKFEPKTVIMNQLVKGRKNIVNFICLLTKQFIYRQRCGQKEIRFYPLLEHFKLIERTEKYIAVKNKKVKQHEYKWGMKSRDMGGQTAQNFVQEYVDQM